MREYRPLQTVLVLHAEKITIFNILRQSNDKNKPTLFLLSELCSMHLVVYLLAPEKSHQELFSRSAVTGPKNKMRFSFISISYLYFLTQTWKAVGV